MTETDIDTEKQQTPSQETPTARQEVPGAALNRKAELVNAIKANLLQAHNTMRSMGPLFATGIRLVADLLTLPGVSNKDIAEALTGEPESVPGLSLVQQTEKAGGAMRVGSPYSVEDPKPRGSKQFATPYRFLGRVQAGLIEKADQSEGWATYKAHGVIINGNQYRSPAEALDAQETLTSVYRALKNMIRPTVHELVNWSDSQAKACESAAPKMTVVIRAYDPKIKREHLKRVNVVDDSRVFRHTLLGLIKAARGKFQLSEKAYNGLSGALLTLTEAADEDETTEE